MIPILYPENETAFLSGGLGHLGDVISCFVTEERNGIFELEMQYPVTGIHYEEIQKSRIISAIPSDGKGRQAFRIYKIEKPINGVVTIYAEHISYQANMIPVMPFTAGSPSETIAKFESNSVTANPFTIWTDIISTANYRHRVPKSLRACLGGSQGSFLDTYGGEFEWDNWNIKIHSQRGMDDGVVLRYGKNLVDLEQEENIQETYTGILPYWYNEEDDVLVTLTERVIMSSNAENFPFSRVLPVDFSSHFEERPTVSQLENAARSYVTNNRIGIPKVSLSVSFVPLWQTDEYKHVANLERVNLCDTVRVEFEKLGVSVSAKVIKTKYNVLLERYDKIEIGETRSNFASTIVKQEEETEQQIQNTKSDYKRAIAKASDLIRGGLGGYVYLKPNANGEPEEILIMDEPDINDAVNVIRMNKNGIAFSQNGYNPSDFSTAWTIDGAFNANYITAGTMSANRVRAGTLQDQVGNIIFNLDAGTLTAKNLAIDTQTTGGSFTVDTLNFDIDSNGNVTLNNATLNNVDASGSISSSYGLYTVSINGGQFIVYRNKSSSLEDDKVIGYFGGNHYANDQTKNGISIQVAEEGEYFTIESIVDSTTIDTILRYAKQTDILNIYKGTLIYGGLTANGELRTNSKAVFNDGLIIYNINGSSVEYIADFDSTINVWKDVDINGHKLQEARLDLDNIGYYSSARITQDNPTGLTGGTTGVIQVMHPNGSPWYLTYDHGILVRASGTNPEEEEQ